MELVTHDDITELRFNDADEQDIKLTCDKVVSDKLNQLLKEIIISDIIVNVAVKFVLNTVKLEKNKGYKILIQPFGLVINIIEVADLGIVFNIMED